MNIGPRVQNNNFKYDEKIKVLKRTTTKLQPILSSNINTISFNNTTTNSSTTNDTINNTNSNSNPFTMTNIIPKINNI